MILDKQSLSCLAAISKQNENIYSLTHAYVDPVGRYVYASNGHLLFRSTINHSYTDDDYPSTVVRKTDPSEPFLVDGKVLEAGIKNASKSSRSMGVLKTVMVTTDEDKVIVSSCKKLDCITTMTTTASKGRQYPDVVEVQKEIRKDAIQSTVCASVDTLEIICKALRANGSRFVKIELRGEDKAWSFTSEDKLLDGLVMPAQL